MNFSEQPPSKQWAALKYRGEKFAEVWFKPEGEPCALTFRIPQKSFAIPGMAQQLTAENLLKAVTIAPEEVESWRHGDNSHAGMTEADPELGSPLPPPPPDIDHLEIIVRLKPPPQAAPGTECAGPGLSLKEWQDRELHWKIILGLEAAVDTMRIEMEALQIEMEASLTKTLTIEEKTHALRADIARWNKAKHRVLFQLPKLKEFIHRAVWALSSPERKRLAEIYKDHIEPQIPFPELDKVLPQLESMQKNRQVLNAQGVTVSQESRKIAAEVQASYRTMQNNALANALDKKGAAGAKGKFFKSVRKWSGADG